MNKNFFLIIILITAYGSCNLEAAPKPMPDLPANGDSAQSSESHDGRPFFNKFIHHKASSSLKIILPADRMKEPLLKQIFDSLFRGQVLESIRKKHEEVEYASLFSAINKKYFIAPLNKEAFQCPVAHDVLLDRIAAHIAYGLTKSKIVTISSDNTFVTKLLAAADYSEDKSYLHTPNIGAISSDPLKQKETLEYLEKLIKQYKEHNDKASSCCACLEPYRALAFTGKAPKIESHMPEPKKIAITYCSQGHTMCVACCNNAEIDTCPLCREPFGIEKKILFCQTCAVASKNLKFMYCAECKSVGVLCKDCTQMPCCRKIESKTIVEKLNVVLHLNKIREKMQFKHDQFIAEQANLLKADLMALRAMIDKKQEDHNSEIISLMPALYDLCNEIAAGQAHMKERYGSSLASSEPERCGEYLYDLNALNNLITELAQKKAIIDTKRKEFGNERKQYEECVKNTLSMYYQKVNKRHQNHQALLNTLSEMGKPHN